MAERPGSGTHVYLKTPKISDARKLSCNTHNIQIKGPNLMVFLQKDSNGIANSEDPDLIWVCTVCPDLFVQKLRIITVSLRLLKGHV